MTSPYLEERLDTLLRTQNPDGGWSFYAGKRQSWLEPTMLSALALHGQPGAETATARAWEAVAAWQTSSGGWRPAAQIPGANWTTALAVLLAHAQGRDAAAISKGLEWLSNSRENGAWPWRAGNPVVAEPTALAVVALARAQKQAGRDVGRFVESGAEFLHKLDLQPQTAGPVLVGLQAQSSKEAQDRAAQWRSSSPSALQRAWLTLGLRLTGSDPDDVPGPIPASRAIVAWEALAARGGNHKVFEVAA